MIVCGDFEKQVVSNAGGEQGATIEGDRRVSCRCRESSWIRRHHSSAEAGGCPGPLCVVRAGVVKTEGSMGTPISNPVMQNSPDDEACNGAAWESCMLSACRGVSYGTRSPPGTTVAID